MTVLTVLTVRVFALGQKFRTVWFYNTYPSIHPSLFAQTDRYPLSGNSYVRLGSSLFNSATRFSYWPNTLLLIIPHPSPPLPVHFVNVNNVNNKFIEHTGTRVSSARLGCHFQCCANRNVFNWRLKLSIESSGSLRYSGKLFQMVGPATATLSSASPPTQQASLSIIFSYFQQFSKSSVSMRLKSIWLNSMLFLLVEMNDSPPRACRRLLLKLFIWQLYLYISGWPHVTV